MSAEIIAIRANGVITKANLVEMSTNPEFQGYAIVCCWKDGTHSAGWSNMSGPDLAYCASFLDQAVKKDLFGKLE